LKFFYVTKAESSEEIVSRVQIVMKVFEVISENTRDPGRTNPKGKPTYSENYLKKITQTHDIANVLRSLED